MARVGLVAPIFQFWDRPTDSLVAEFDHAILKNDTEHPFVVQCEQFKTAKLLLQRVEKLPNVEVMYGHPVTGVTQDANSASVTVRGPDREETHKGAYVIGADGGRSTVRKASGIAFDGFTWPERFIVFTTPFDFESRARLLLPQLFRRPGSVVQLLQGLGRRPAGALAYRLPDRLHDIGSRTDQQRCCAVADAQILSRSVRLRGRPP